MRWHHSCNQAIVFIDCLTVMTMMTMMMFIMKGLTRWLLAASSRLLIDQIAGLDSCLPFNECARQDCHDDDDDDDDNDNHDVMLTMMMEPVLKKTKKKHTFPVCALLVNSN